MSAPNQSNATTIVIVGPANAGKTTLVRYLLGKERVNVLSTAGFQYEEVKHKNLIFNIYDVGGQPTFVHTFWKKFVSMADAVIFVVDATDQQSITTSRDYLRYIVTWIRRVPLLVLGNKNDVLSAIKMDNLMNMLEIEDLMMDLDCSAFQLFTTSGKTGQGISEAFDWLAENAIKQTPPQKKVVNLKKIIVFDANPGIAVFEPNEVEMKNDSLDGQANVKVGKTKETKIATGIDIHSDLFTATSVRSITIVDEYGQNLVLIKEIKDDVTCVIICNEGDDFSIRELAKSIAEWAVEERKRNPKGKIAAIEPQVFTQKVNEILTDLQEIPGELKIDKEDQRQTIHELIDRRNDQ